MTTKQQQLDSQIFGLLQLISQSESKMKEAVKALKRIAAKQDDPTLMTEEEFFQRIDEASKGPTYTMQPGETLEDLIKRAV